MSLLTIIQGAARRCRFTTIPTSVVGNTDPDVQQLFGFAQDVGTELVERGDWTALKTQTSVTGDGSTTEWSLPSDWKRLCPNSDNALGSLVSLARPTIPLIGPVSDEWLNQAKALPIMPAFPVWRRIGIYLEIWPALAAAEVVQYWYFSSLYALDASSGATKVFAADTDTGRINEDTMMKGVVWRWLQSKGLDYAEAFRQYELSISRNLGQENSGRIASMSATPVFPQSAMLGTITYPAS